jgi:hypothetical protein
MSEFRIAWSMETWHETVVQADSLEHARAKFWENPAGWIKPDTVTDSNILQDSIDVEVVG